MSEKQALNLSPLLQIILFCALHLFAQITIRSTTSHNMHVIANWKHIPISGIRFPFGLDLQKKTYKKVGSKATQPAIKVKKNRKWVELAL